MKVTSKGQVTIPAEIREQIGIHAGDEVDFHVDGTTIRVVRRAGSETRGQRMARRLRGSGTAADTAGMTTDQLMELLRGE